MPRYKMLESLITDLTSAMAVTRVIHETDKTCRRVVVSPEIRHKIQQELRTTRDWYLPPAGEDHIAGWSTDYTHPTIYGIAIYSNEDPKCT